MATKICINCKQQIESSMEFCPFCAAQQPGKAKEKKEEGQKTVKAKPVAKPKTVPKTFVPVNVEDQPDIKEKVESKKAEPKPEKQRKSKAELELEHQAMHDSLTGLLNARAFEKILSEVSVNDLCLVSVDANNLKMTNDTYGHRYGDILLNSVAKALLEVFREDECYRVGGDEFWVVLPSVGEQSILPRIDEFKAKLGEETKRVQEAEHLTNTFVISAAVGFAISDGKASIQQLKDQADSNMYVDKKEMKKSAQKEAFDPRSHIGEDGLYDANFDGYYNDIETAVIEEEKKYSIESAKQGILMIVMVVVFVIIVEWILL